jgi:hypothetical protein
MATVTTWADRTIECFENGSHFLYTENVVIDTISPSLGSERDDTANKASSSNLEIPRFPLEDQSFVDLQVYLKSALKLPGDMESFHLNYPEELFGKYLSKDRHIPSLYRVITYPVIIFEFFPSGQRLILH